MYNVVELAVARNHWTQGLPKSSIQTQAEGSLSLETFKEMVSWAFHILEKKELAGKKATVSMEEIASHMRMGMDRNGGYTGKRIIINQSHRAPHGRNAQILEPDLDGKLEMAKERTKPCFRFDWDGCSWFRGYKPMGRYGYAIQKMTDEELAKAIRGMNPCDWPVGLSGLLPVSGIDFTVPQLAGVFYAGIECPPRYPAIDGQWTVVEQKLVGSMWRVLIRSNDLVDVLGVPVEHETFGKTPAEALARAWGVIQKRRGII